MKRFVLISNPKRDPGLQLRARVREYISLHGGNAITDDEISGTLPAGTDAILVLGGDGTLLRAVHKYGDAGVPFLGINTGNIGYLTAGNADNAEPILDHLLQDAYETESRMMLQGCIFRDGRVVSRHRGLNDVVISRTDSLKLIRLNVYVNGNYLCQYRADGLIAATPTGSTAYSFSAGGPIVEPTANLFVLTPIASHALNNRSIVMSPSDRIEVEIADTASYSDDLQCDVFFDSEKPQKLLPGDRVEISQASTCISLIKLNNQSFIDTLRIKLSD